MTGPDPSEGATALYRFLQPGGTEAEQRRLPGDEAAEDCARELSKQNQTPITVQRRDDVDWEYVTEADERS
jgi:hypothetical protein